MAKTALTQLQEQIESIRREAFAEGYAAAMQAVREFAVRPAAAALRPAAAPPRPAAGASRPAARASRPGRKGRARAERRGQGRRPKAAAAAARPQRGNNARLIEEVLQGMAPRAVRPAEIRNVLRREKGIAMAFTSIRHALAQLQARRAAEQIGNTRTWRYLPQGGASGASG
jgi:hypothetical protein